MKYLPIRDFETVTSALNFDTVDLHVIGGCDLYTIKAASDDKKLYKKIEDSLQSNYQSYIELSKSLSPPEREALAASLSRSMPFGPPSQPSSRRKYAYLIATLNASHPDYDFSHTLRPADFRKLKNPASVRGQIDPTLYNLRPQYSGAFLYKRSTDLEPAGCRTPGGSEAWSPQMWGLVDEHMSLADCEVYHWSPEEDPFEDEEGALWSYHFFFYNRYRKRVCYLYLRGLSMLGHSPSAAALRRKSRGGWPNLDLSTDPGAQKRAKFWFGDKRGASNKARYHDVERREFEDEEVDGVGNPLDDDDEVDVEPMVDIRSPNFEYVVISDDDDDMDMMDDDDGFGGFGRRENDRSEREKSAVRAMSAEVADSMEI